MKRSSLLFAGLVAIGLSFPLQASAQGPAVVQVIGVDVNGDLAAFLGQFRKYQALTEQLEITGEARVYQATLSGEDTLSVYIVIEYADFETMARESSRVQASEGWQAIVAENQKLGIRPVNNSLSVDITP